MTYSILRFRKFDFYGSFKGYIFQANILKPYMYHCNVTTRQAVRSTARAEKNNVGNQSRPKCQQESQSARKESSIGSDPILFLTIFPRLWPRLSSRLLVTNVTILPYCMVITSPRTGSLRDNITVASRKLGASFETFLTKTFFLK